MKAEQLVVVQGWADTRTTLRRWNAAPWGVLRSWALGSLAVTALLLAATWLVAVVSIPDPGVLRVPGRDAARSTCTTSPSSSPATAPC